MAHKRVLLIGSRDHDTSLVVLETLLGRMPDVSTTVLDGSSFGERLYVSARFPHGSGSRSALTLHSGDECLMLEDVGSIWNRRWHDPRLLGGLRENESAQEFGRENWRRLAQALCLCSEATWVNHPVKQLVAANKVYQLEVAARVGFVLPETLFTADPAEARQFVGAHPRGVVCKSIGNTFAERATVTVLLNPEHVAALEALPLSPAIFQEYVAGARDVRVIVVGEHAFAAEIDTAKGIDPVDWRVDADNPWSLHRLPRRIERRCTRLTRRLGLHYGAIDLRLTAQGEYVFFEINPAGQFLFVEVWTGMPIAQTLADLLVSAPAARPVGSRRATPS
jgi:hypothetical protein